MARLFIYQSVYFYREYFISPSGMSDICGTAAGMVTPERSISTEGLALRPGEPVIT
jgi:hypothetical protein